MVARSKRSFNKKWLLRALAPLVVVVLWFGVASVGGPYFGKIDQVSTNDPATFLPESAQATKVNERLEKFRDSESIPAILVIESKSPLNQEQNQSINNLRSQLDDSQISNGEVSPAVISEDEKAALVIVPVASDAEFDEVVTDLKSIIDNSLADSNGSLSYEMTGPAIFSRDLQNAFAGIDGTLLVVALTVVFVILLIVYRSPILPLVTLSGAMAALCAAILVIFYLAKADVVTLNGQVQGILFILTIGAATDYSLLYIARYREELQKHQSAVEATKASWRASVEPIVAAGGTVILGLLCLLASDLGSNQALGPVGGIGIVFAIFTALTFLPAALLLLGRNAFWPRPPEFQSKAKLTQVDSHRVWRRVASLVSRRPRRLWIGICSLLVLACFGVLQLDATGVSQENLILGPSDAREGQKALKQHFPEGAGSPAYVLTPESQQQATIETIEQIAGINSVAITTDSSQMSIAPVGQQRQEILSDIREEVVAKVASQRSELRRSIEEQMTGAPQSRIDAAYSRAAGNIPSVDKLVKQANPFKGLEAKVVDRQVLLQATLSDPSSSVAAQDTIETVRTKLDENNLDAEVGGVSAIQLDTIKASDRDLMVIIPLILIAITIVLMLLLRSIVAPLLLVLTTVLSFGATLGVSALLFNHVWNFPGADPAVIIFGFVFLVALGIDYNIFLMTRVREETQKSGVREGTLHALVVTGGVITSAGIVLAATFAALYVIPILFLAQISFIVAFGVLIDTLIVRSLLVPALTIEIGRKMWWPSKLSKRK